MEDNRTALEKWANDNDVSGDYLRFVINSGHDTKDKTGTDRSTKEE